MKKVVLYLNQFFGQIGGETEADYPPSISEGPVGPGLAIQTKLKDAQITHTIICGDNFMNTHTEEAIEKIAGLLEGIEMDLFLAGPAFMAGRYGVNCGVICKYVRETRHIPVITCMYEENPGVDMYKKDMYILKGGDSARTMRKDAAKMTELANKLLAGEELRGADAEGYFGRGILKQVFYEEKKPSARRAVEMLVKKLAGEPYQTELKIEQGERVPITPAITDMSKIKFALVTSGGIVPVENPDRIPSASATAWGKYDISSKDLFVGGKFKTVHAGYDPSYADANPNVVVPVDVVHDMVSQGKIGSLYPYLFSTTGNHTNGKEAVRMAREMAEQLLEAKVGAVLYTST